MIPATMRLPLARLTRTRRAWLPALLWAALAIVAASAERARYHAADRTLQSTFGAIVLPLLAYAIVGAALHGDGLARSSRALVAFGADPARVAWSSIVSAAGVSAIACALVGAVVASIAHGASDPPLARDVLTSAWVSGLGAIAYAAFFAFGASFGKRGAGRSFFLVVDWLLGAGSGYGAFITPRPHVRSLLGGTGILSLPGRVSALMLVLLAVAFALFAVRRASRAA